MSKVYRAADKEAGKFWMIDKDNAVAYLNNGHLGGNTMYTSDINLDSLLDLTDRRDFHDFMENVLGEDYLNQCPDYTDTVELAEVIAKVKTYGMAGILFTDNYPMNAVACYVFEAITGTIDQDSQAAIDSVRDLEDEDIEALVWSDLHDAKYGFFSVDAVAEALRIDRDRVDFDLDDDEITITITNIGGYSAEATIEKGE